MISLKTHSVYPEIDVNGHNVFTAKLIKGDGEVVFDEIGAGKDRADAITRAKNMLDKEAEKHVLEDK